MALPINTPEIEELVQELVAYTGESAPQAVARALRARLALERARRQTTEVQAEALIRIGQKCAALPVLDDRPADVILGYDETGLPT